ncbi:MAG TPA: alpha/beta fold hydrolase [Burkholderiaceae bacterium]
MVSLNRLKGWLVRCVACTMALLAGPCLAQTVPTADFFKPAAFSSLRMSPSGKRLCATVPRADGRLSLAVLDLDDLSKSKVVAGYAGYDVWGAEWVNDERLVFRIYDQSQPLATQRGTGLFAVSATNGEAPRVLIRPEWNSISESTRIVSRALQPNHLLHSVLRDGSNDVVVGEHLFGTTGEVINISLKRLDTTTGIARSISFGAPAGATDWTLDAAGEPRVVQALNGGSEITYWKPKADGPWVKLAKRDVYDGIGGFEPIRVDAANRLYASARLGAADTASLVVIDMAQAAGQPRELLATPGFDFEGDLVLNGRSDLLGIDYLTDARATLWLDPALKKIQEQVDALLPGTVNRLDCGQCDRKERVLVTSFADRQPATYRLFDSKTGTLVPITDSRPWIQPKAMAARDMVRISTRDGLSMPVHVTRPNGQKGPLPMVVLVHGGPFVRGGEWGWDADSQFLASRGYVVVEPEFRGSTGFGFKHFRAGWKQWGLAMQDDVADAAKWAVQQGHADPKRICIAGASYGGYATLMGLIRHPELFRCGVQWVGVTDIELMYTIHWSDFSEVWTRYGMPRLVGDRQRDADQLVATSPVRQASRVTQPLLMAYGGVDRRVPIEHGTIFRDAVRKSNKNVEWIDYAEEGHGWLLPANSVDFWNRVEKFLDKNLKNAP